MSEKKYKLSRTNMIMIIICLLIIIVGFILMIGEPSGLTYNPDIYSVRRITVGPMVAFFGFLAMIFAILYKPKDKNKSEK